MSNVEDRLLSIERSQAEACGLLSGISDKLDGFKEWRGEVELTLHGDGNGHRGLLVRLDRLEQQAERGKWTTRALAAALLALLGKAGAGLLGY